MKTPVVLVVFVLLVLESQAAVDDSTGMPCDFSAECGSGYCCLSNTRPRGKRQLTGPLLGTCQALGSAGDACFVSPRYEGNLVYYEECPCEAGLTCHGNGRIDVPLGEMGVCH